MENKPVKQSAYEGLIDTYFNRIVGRPLTGLFIRHAIPANAVTALSAATGVLSAWCFATSGYACGVGGALLFQAAAVLDCCDGEVARRTETASEWGGTLDLLSDYISYAAVFLAIGWRVCVAESTWNALGYGITAAVASAFTMHTVSRLKREKTGRDPHSKLIDALATRDFSVLVVIVALADWFAFFIRIAAVGTSVFWLYSQWLLRGTSADQHVGGG